MKTPSIFESRHKTSGVTLVELMIAMAIVGLVMGSAFSALRPAMLASENSRLNVAANEMLLAETERLRAMGWDEILELEDQSEFFTEIADPRFATNRWFSSREDREDQLQVILEVRWNDAAGKPQKARIVTFITQYGISA